ARIYDPRTNTYESEADFRRRIEEDVRTITARLKSATGKTPRVWVWPYGRVDGTTLQIVQDNGYSIAMKLEDGLVHVNDLINMPRVLNANDPLLDEFARSAVYMENVTRSEERRVGKQR